MQQVRGLLVRSVPQVRAWAEPAVAADGAGMTAFRAMKSLQPAPLLNFVVRLQKEWRWHGQTS